MEAAGVLYLQKALVRTGKMDECRFVSMAVVEHCHRQRDAGMALVK